VRWQLGVLVTGLLASSAVAEPRTPEVALAAGYWGLRAHEPHELAVQLELRPGVRWWWVRPTAGFLFSSEGTVSPGFAPAIRMVNGKRDLGSVLLFKSSVELAVPLTPGLRALLSFAHVSNGKLATPNPGIETLLFGLSAALE
jgi:lipid A 3-O-deacylase PagL